MPVSSVGRLGSRTYVRSPSPPSLRPWPTCPQPVSAAEAEVRYESAVALQIVPLEVAQQAAALADQHQQAAAGVVILAVRAQVAGEIVNPLGEQGDLYFGRPGVATGATVLVDQLGLLFLGPTHAGWKLPQTRRASSVSRRIWTIRASESSKRRSPRRRSTKATRRLCP